jgi:hypothetical protein
MKKNAQDRWPRRSVLAAYILVAGFLCTCITVSVYRGARARMAESPPLAPIQSVDRVTLAWCMSQLDALFLEQNERLDATLASQPARRSSVEWEDWSPQWRERLLQVGARCRLSRGDAEGSRKLKAVYDRLLELHRHYTTLAVQFSKEIGPYSDTLHQALEKARESVSHPAPRP